MGLQLVLTGYPDKFNDSFAVDIARTYGGTIVGAHAVQHEVEAQTEIDQDAEYAQAVEAQADAAFSQFGHLVPTVGASAVRGM